MSSRLWQQPIQGLDIGEDLFAGNFSPAGTGAPKVNSPHSGKFTVSRTATGTFVVILFGASGAFNNFNVQLQLDPASADLSLQAVPGPIGVSAGRVSLTIFIQDTTSGALTDITQPVSPTENGCSVHFMYVSSNRQPIALGSL